MRGELSVAAAWMSLLSMEARVSKSVDFETPMIYAMSVIEMRLGTSHYPDDRAVLKTSC